LRITCSIASCADSPTAGSPASSASASAWRASAIAGRRCASSADAGLGQIDGGDQIGYLVAHLATRLAIDKAKTSGIAIVGANETWYTGMLSYYAEMMAAEGLVSMMASNTSPWVAPHGASEGRFGTNPICFGFPSTADPVIWDVGTAAIIHADVTRTSGSAGARGRAFSICGAPRGSGTSLPVRSRRGAVGAGLARPRGCSSSARSWLAPIPPEAANFGFFVLAVSPSLFGSEEGNRR
jgi:hypothetical protein